MRFAVAVGLAALTGAGCSRPVRPASAPLPAAPAAVVWAPSLELASVTAVPDRLAKPFAAPFDVAVLGPDGLPKQATMANCIDYFNLRPKGFEPLAQPDLAAMKIEGAACLALKSLEAARPATRRSLRPFPLTQDALGRLPPVLGPMVNPVDSDRRTQASKQRRPWSSVDPEAKVVPSGEWKAQVTGKDWTTDLDILARGDLNGDGADDLLIGTISTGSVGSWSEVRLRLLTSLPGDPVLQVVKDYPL